jgi:DNA-binding XRE family transcriptional regulator
VALFTRDTNKARNLIAFGAQVRCHRIAAGWSQDQLGAKIPVSGSFIGKIERGEVRCTRQMAKTLDQLFGLPGSLEKLWEDLDMSAAFPVWFDWHKVEAEAIRLCSYQCMVVYGLLQTEDYARVLLKGNEEATAARLGRQEILTRENPPPPHLCVLLTEAALHNPVGNKETMRGQFERLLDASTMERVTIQVVPGMIPPEGSSGAFVTATMPDRTELVYLDSAARGFTLSEAQDLEHLTTAYDAIRSQALPEKMSRDFILKVLEERWT